MRKNYLFLLLLLLNFTGFSQVISLSEEAEVSILTMGPGANLYDKFGHSAFRIQDPSRNIDIVYNYGVYDFDTPNFYTKFARGKLLYKLQASPYEPFANMYVRQGRWIKEQILNLSYSEKTGIFRFLQNNALPENQYYKYDFFFDNCATKIRDVLVTVLGEKLEYRTNFAEQEDRTFRQLIQQNVHWNTWGSMGMDIAIGAVVDQKATSWEYQFLPNYVLEAANGATIQRQGAVVPLVKETREIYAGQTIEDSSNLLTSPVLFFGLLGLLLVFFTFRDHRRNGRNRKLDAVVFTLTGLIGLILLFLWFGTEHTTTANNYNLLWAFPPSLFLAVLIYRKTTKRWLQRYVIFLLLMLILMGFHWVSGVQVFAWSMLPLFIGLFVRYFYLAGYLRRENS